MGGRGYRVKSFTAEGEEGQYDRQRAGCEVKRTHESRPVHPLPNRAVLLHLAPPLPHRRRMQLVVVRVAVRRRRVVLDVRSRRCVPLRQQERLSNALERWRRVLVRLVLLHHRRRLQRPTAAVRSQRRRRRKCALPGCCTSSQLRTRHRLCERFDRSGRGRVRRGCRSASGQGGRRRCC